MWSKISSVISDASKALDTADDIREQLYNKINSPIKNNSNQLIKEKGEEYYPNLFSIIRSPEASDTKEMTAQYEQSIKILREEIDVMSNNESVNKDSISKMIQENNEIKEDNRKLQDEMDNLLETSRSLKMENEELKSKLLSR